MSVVYGKPLYFDKSESLEAGAEKIEKALHKIDKIASKHE